MKLKFIIWLTLFLLLPATLLAQGGGYNLDWWAVAGGGGTLSGGGYTLSGTAGQAAAGSLSGGGYSLLGDFWGVVGAVAEYRIFLPLVLRNY